MRKILLLSDTHSYLDEEIVKHVKQADEVWHAGDIGNVEVTDTIKKYTPLRAVHGNIDGSEVRKEFPEDLFFKVEKVNVYMTHIGGYPGRYTQRVRSMIERKRPNLFVCGHSHILKVMYDKKYQMMTMNPGAIGKYGFHVKRTMLRFEIEDKDIQNLAVIEYSRKSEKS